MLGRQSQTQITHRNEKDGYESRQDLLPGFSEEKDRQPQNWKDEAGFFAERAQEKQSGGGDEEQPPVRPELRRSANTAVKSEKTEHRRQRIGPTGDVRDGGGMHGMNRPDKRGEECQPTSFALLDVPAAQELIGQKKERERGAGMTKDAREMIAGRFENERSVISEVSEPLNWPVEIRGCRVDEKKMLERLGRELPAPDEWIAQDQGGVVPDKIVSERRRVDRENDEN